MQIIYINLIERIIGTVSGRYRMHCGIAAILNFVLCINKSIRRWLQVYGGQYQGLVATVGSIGGRYPPVKIKIYAARTHSHCQDIASS